MKTSFTTADEKRTVRDKRRCGMTWEGSAKTKRGAERDGREVGPGGTHQFSLYLR